MNAQKVFKGFASDNNAAVHPLVMEALQNANLGHAIAYGDDDYTRRAEQKIKAQLGEHCEIYFVFGGTGANVLGLQAVTQSFEAIICAETAHIQTDECGAPERFTGCKLLSVATPDGKLTPNLVKKHLHGFGFEHHSQPKVISITQATELGTVYRPSEIKALADLAHQYQMLLHMDGARLANAAASLNCSLAEITSQAGVDLLSLGGTKNGLMYGEAIVFFRPELARQMKYKRKQAMQLASKMRYIGAQFDALFTHDLWLRNAQQANQMAKILAERVGRIPQIEITQKVEANGVFARVPAEIIAPLQETFFFYEWDEHTHEVRWMCSWDTTPEEIEIFANRLSELIGA